MKCRDAAWLAASTLRKNPLRTLLTILGMGVGVGAVLTVLALGSAGEEQVECQIERLGVNKVWITARPGYTLDTADSHTVAAATGARACAGAYAAGVVHCEGKSVTAQICGFDSGMDAVHGMTLLQGRSFTTQEHAGGRVALMEQRLAQALDARVGQWVDSGSRRVKIVGIFTGLQVQATPASNGMFIMPLQTVLDTFSHTGVSEITLSVPREDSPDRVETVAAAALGDGFRAQSLQEEIDAARSVVRIFVMVLVCVAFVCMLTGGIGVMNILLVSVRERRREIGLIKAIGGTPRQIGLMFLLEGVGYALLGGGLGIALGMVMIRLFGRWIGLEAALTFPLALTAAVCAGALGVFFGVVPALRAACMQPVDALKKS